MGWEVLIPLIIQVGVPAAEKLFQLYQAKQPPTQADWDSLKELGKQTPRTQMEDALRRSGIALDDPKAAPLLALVK